MNFNNNRRRNHRKLYGINAFFDLETSERQAKVADEINGKLSVNDECIVATPDVTHDSTSPVTFERYRFTHHQIMTDPERNVPCHAYFGTRFDSETLTRQEAIEHRIYGRFFNSRGHFKQPSVPR